MQVVRWGDSFAMRLLAAAIEALRLENGDATSRSAGTARALDRVRALRRPLPACWRFDREEANRR